MYALRCPVQTYDWGKKGNDSLVARIASQHDTTFKLKEDQSYAELWMGTHKNGPAEICVDGKSEYMLLNQWLENKSAAGSLPNSFESCGTLPFLLKILSVDTALSIQAHPDMELAINLHEAFPDIYKDPNHKPEMAVALTPFEAICGFRDLQEILRFFYSVPEFKDLVGEKVIKDMEADPSPFTLRAFFCAFVNSDERKIKVIADKLCKRLKQIEEKERTEIENLVLRLSNQHPGDIGIFCPYLLNYIKLQPGQAVFLSANEPHAYIAGDCVECMACSDNVVRAGLTRKFIDKLTLCDMLSYSYGRPEILEGKSLDPSVSLYVPPVDEFCIEKIHIQLKSSLGQIKLRSSSSGSILIVTEGKGKAIIRYKMDENNNIKKEPETIILNSGSTFFICADADVRLESETAEDFICYRARVNTEKKSHH